MKERKRTPKIKKSAQQKEGKPLESYASLFHRFLEEFTADPIPDAPVSPPATSANKLPAAGQ